jgi:hypothetical protein
MAFHELSEEELELLSEIEDEPKVPVEQVAIRKMTAVCQEATKKFIEAYGEESLKFEAVSPSDLPLEMGGRIQLMGMEELTFKKFIPSNKADIICLFEFSEASSPVCIRYEWLEEIFGTRGRKMMSWILSSTNMAERRQQINKEMTANKPERVYKDPSYGAW